MNLKRDIEAGINILYSGGSAAQDEKVRYIYLQKARQSN